MPEFSREDARGGGPVYVVQQPRRGWFTILMGAMLVFSVMLNLLLVIAVLGMMAGEGMTYEKNHSGDPMAKDKIVRLMADFTIMPPYTEHILKVIDDVEKDDAVKGVVLVVDSPGGLVSDSHQIYHRLKKLSAKKPIYVSMKGVAASGGYYISMGAGPDGMIFAEPTTWTGSIGVILPRYNARELGEKIGVTAESLATGPLKDTLNPLKELSPEEREVWRVILDDSFQRFLQVIDEGRAKLDLEQVRALATGQVYTANQAVENGLVDKVGFEEDAIEALKTKLNLTSVNVVEYETPQTLAELLLGASLKAPSHPLDALSKVVAPGAPRAMYFFGSPAL